jgi:hypothetical protein
VTERERERESEREKGGEDTFLRPMEYVMGFFYK